MATRFETRTMTTTGASVTRAELDQLRLPAVEKEIPSAGGGPADLVVADNRLSGDVVVVLGNQAGNRFQDDRLGGFLAQVVIDANPNAASVDMPGPGLPANLLVVEQSFGPAV